MGNENLLALLGSEDLANFGNTIQQSNPYGIAGQTLAAWQPDYSTFSPAASGMTAFGKAFLSGLLGNYARNDTASQMQKVVGVLPQLQANPASVVMPEGVDPAAFSMLQGSSILKNLQRDAVEQETQRKFNSDLAMKLLGKKAEILGENQAYSELGGTGVENPNSPQYKVTKDKEEKLITLRKDFNALDPVKNFAKASQAANALSGALRDKNKVSDQELVRYSILMIEPGMAVREGEQGAVANSQSIPEAWKGQLEGALNGKSVLGEDIRQGIRNLASRAYTSHKSLYDQAHDLYSKEATLQGLDPSRLSYIGNAPNAESVFGAMGTPIINPIDELKSIKNELQTNLNLSPQEKSALVNKARELAKGLSLSDKPITSGVTGKF